MAAKPGGCASRENERMRRTSASIPLLVGESFSPWTQKARWALEYCNVPHRYQEYVPTLGEPGLRLRMRQWRGTLSVPVLRVGKTWLAGSWAIACHAAAVANDVRLGDPGAVAGWNELGEAALAEGRTRVVRAIACDSDALLDALPPFIAPRWRPRLRWLAADAVRRLDRKYAGLVVEGSLAKALHRTREALARNGCDHLLGGRFSYADIAMLVVLECVAPVARTTPPMAASIRRHWHDPALAAEFADLLAWRARLLASPAVASSQFAGACVPV